MNPKLRDLQIQAFAECRTFEDSQFKTDEVFERFAELIVRECTNMVEEHQPRYLTRRQAQEMADTIREHFGVEE